MADAITAAGNYVTSEGKPASPRVVNDGDPSVRTPATRARGRTSRSTSRTAVAAAGGAAVGAARAPGRTARGVTAGKSALAAELLLGYGIVLIRVVGDFELVDGGASKGKLATDVTQGQDVSVGGKSVKMNVGHPAGQYGPFPIAIGLTLAFFLLSFLARFGGAKSVIANIMGGCIILVLAMKSMNEINFVANVFANIGKITEPAPSGTESSGANGNVSTPTGTGTGTTKPATGTGTNTKVATSGVSPIPASSAQTASNFSILENDLKGVAETTIQSFDLAHPGQAIAATQKNITDFEHAFGEVANLSHQQLNPNTDAEEAASFLGWLKNTIGI